jgi:dihydrofolate reductase
MRHISIIVAIAENYAIGLRNELLFHLSDDLKRFRKLTTGHTIIMGKRTFESLPNRPLQNRRSLVITDIPGEIIPGCEMAYSIEDAIAKTESEIENFVIGGGSIYRQFLPYVDKLYITWVHKSFEADTFFPKIDLSEWEILEETDIPFQQETGFAYSYCIYKRKTAPKMS